MAEPGRAGDAQSAVTIACLADLSACRTTALSLRRVGAPPLRVVLVGADLSLADGTWVVTPLSAVLHGKGVGLADVLAQVLDPQELAARLTATVAHDELTRAASVTIVAPGTVVLAPPDACLPETLRMPAVLAERNPLPVPTIVTLGQGLAPTARALAESYETRLATPADPFRDLAYAATVTSLGGRVDDGQCQAPTLGDVPEPALERHDDHWWVAGSRLAAVGRGAAARRDGGTVGTAPHSTRQVAEIDRLCSALVESALRDVAGLDLPASPSPSWSAALKDGVRELLTEMPDELRRWRAIDDSARDEFARWLRRPTARTRSVVPNGGVAMWRSRPDLQASFPDPVLADSDAYLAWLRGQGAVEEPALGEFTPGLLERPQRPPRARPAVAAGPVVRVVGYLEGSLGLGAAARHLVAGLCRGGAEVHTIAITPGMEDKADGTSDAPPVDVTVWAVNPPECRLAMTGHPDLVTRARLNVGYWWWEVPWLPPVLAQSVGPLDEIWVGSEHVLHCFDGWRAAEVVRAPLVLPLQLPCSSLTRDDLGLPTGVPLYLARADLHSSLARKNPEGAITAFLSAFPTSGEAHLVVKLLNASSDPAAFGRLRSLTAGRTDVTLLTKTLDEEDNNALTALADVLVSLHRSEGLGLPIAEAMALGTAVLATDHGGSRDLLGADGGWLVPGAMVPVLDPSGTYLDGMWAEPDHAEAVRGIRALAAPEARASLVTAAKRRLAAFDDPEPLAAFLTDRVGQHRAGQRRSRGRPGRTLGRRRSLR